MQRNSIWWENIEELYLKHMSLPKSQSRIVSSLNVIVAVV